MRTMVKCCKRGLPEKLGTVYWNTAALVTYCFGLSMQGLRLIWIALWHPLCLCLYVRNYVWHWSLPFKGFNQISQEIIKIQVGKDWIVGDWTLLRGSPWPWGMEANRYMLHFSSCGRQSTAPPSPGGPVGWAFCACAVGNLITHPYMDLLSFPASFPRPSKKTHALKPL